MFFLYFLGIAVKKSIFIIGLILVVLAALGYDFYLKSQKNEPFSTEERSNIPAPLLPSDITESTEAEKEKSLKASFDIVRVEEDGSMIAAGKGVSGAVVSLMDGENIMTDFTVNENGEWVYIPAKPLVPGEHEIWLRDDSMNTREESEVVVVSVPEPKNAEEALAVIISPDAEKVDILQAPAPEIQIDVDIRSVKYVNKSFVIQGSTNGEGQINLYADNLFLGEAQAHEKEWTLRVSKQLEAGKKYTIRADKVDEFGKVLARVEVPFEIEKGLEGKKRRRIRIVKGDCLWSIAKQLYGTGFAYVTIYQANKKQIKNPDLIYPNQVFVLPSRPQKQQKK